ncbi:MAG: nuclear transport factor 2 family protein [Mycobacterium sp.]
MFTKKNIDTTKEAYAAYSTGDVATALSNFDDDIEWFVNGNSKVSGTYRGKAEVLEMLAKLAEKSFTTAPRRFLADGDDVVVLTQSTAGGESGHQVDVYTFSNGKIVKAESFGDTAMTERVYGRK